MHICPTDDTDLRWTKPADGLIRHDGRIYILETGNLWLKVLQYKHDHILLGHFSQNKTLASVQHEYTWPGLWNFITEFCKSCKTCMCSKSQCHQPYGLLKQLPIPEQPWNSISMDFIEQLPKLSGYTAILVVVDCLTKQAIFITLADLTKLFVLHVFSKHGVLSHVMSNWGSKFVSHFFRSLRKALDMRLHFTSGYHPEGNGQMEQTNQTLEQYLRVYSNYQQDNWLDLLPLAEFAYNNAPSMTTGIFPFFANKGYHLNISVHPERELASGKACKFAIDLDALHTALKEQIKTAQSHYQALADACHAPAPHFPTGSYAFVKAQFFCTTQLSKKLMEKYLGPFEVITQVRTHSFMLRLRGQFIQLHMETSFQNVASHPRPQSKLMANRSMKSPKYST